MGKGNQNDNGEETKVVRKMVLLDDFGAVIPMYSITKIEKKTRFIETPRPRWQFGIVINGGMEQSTFHPVTDISAWYEREDTRNKKFEYLCEILYEWGIEIEVI